MPLESADSHQVLEKIMSAEPVPASMRDRERDVLPTWKGRGLQVLPELGLAKDLQLVPSGAQNSLGSATPSHCRFLFGPDAYCYPCLPLCAGSQADSHQVHGHLWGCTDWSALGPSTPDSLTLQREETLLGARGQTVVARTMTHGLAVV